MALSIAYFPSVAWFEAFASSSDILIEAHENYQKQTLRNRCRIMTAGGVQSLVVPITHNGGSKIPICGARLDRSTQWQRLHARAVMSAYRSAPYWEHFEGDIMPLFELKHDLLFDMNIEITEKLISLLSIDRTLKFTEKFEGANIEPQLQCAQPYYQVFEDRYPFAENMSILDAIFCEGRLPISEL